MKLTYEVMQ